MQDIRGTAIFRSFSLVFLFNFLVGIHALKIFHTGRNLVE